MLKYFFLCVTAACLCHCNTEEAAGGACAYRYDTLPAYVAAVNPVDSNQYNLVLLLPHQNGNAPDTFNYYLHNGYYLPASEIQQKHILIHDTLMFIRGTIITGACNPDNSRLLTEHYYSK